jgi:hypothetical protein
VFPHFILPNYFIVPIEIYILNKSDLNSTEMKDIEIDATPPRFVFINLDWNLIVTHSKIMSLFCIAVENKQAIKPKYQHI